MAVFTEFVKDVLADSPFIKEYENSSRKQYLYEEVFELTTRKLDQMTLRDANRYYIKLLERPAIFEVTREQIQLFDVFARLIASYSTQVTGFQDVQMESLDPTNRSEFQSLSQPGRQTGATKTLTIVFPGELTGGLIAKTVRYWMNQMKDRISGVSPMGGLQTQYTLGKISMTILFLKPDPSNTVVEFCAIGQNMWPKLDPYSQNEGNWNDVSVNEVSIDFNVALLDDHNIKVKRYGEAILKDIKSDLIADYSTYGLAGTGSTLEIVTKNPIQ